MSAPSPTLATFTWPVGRLAECIEWLARHAGLSTRVDPMPTSPPSAGDLDALTGFVDRAAASLGIEAEPVECAYPDCHALVNNCGPALLRVQVENEPRLLALLRGARDKIILLTPDLGIKQVPANSVCGLLCRPIESRFIADTTKIIEDAGVPLKRRAAATAGLLRQQLLGERITGCWLLRLPPSAGLWQQARAARIPSRVVALLGAHTVQYLLWLVSWWLMGQAALQGRFDWGWLAAWALLLFTMVPFRLLVTWWQGLVSIRVGALLKRRLLFAALQLQPEEIRHQGAGQLLGRVIESEAVESLALSGGFLSLLAGLELLFAIGVLALGSAAALTIPLLLGWLIVTFIIASHYCRCRNWWTQSRLKLTNDLVEKMVGHRTRLAQEIPERWHENEDQSVSALLALAMAMDRSVAWLAAAVPRGWLVLGLIGITPSFALARTSLAKLAIALGGVLLAFRALQRLTAGLSHLAGASIAWKQIAPIFRGAISADGARTLSSGAMVQPRPGSDASAATAQSSARTNGPVLLEAQDLNFCYRERGLPVLRECSLTIRSGDRIILEGPSGSGKSTLASIVTGLRTPDSGLLLLRGLDRQTVGLAGWRRHVAAAPQFHENHVLTGTFAFNLLMGGPWPPRPETFREAETVCTELGLGDLLKRMPAGLLQLVGESGWQLSHGEKSRLYIARALLQGAELVVLDESFASLDPENLERALRCVLKRARTVLVIAHP